MTELKEKKMKAALYARVSSKEQEEEGYSIPAQLKLLRDYAAKKNYKVVREFVDLETAKRAGRTSFNEMVKFLQSNSEIKILLCEKTDRLYRNFKDYVTIDDLDLQLHFVKEGEVLSKDSRSHEKFIHGIKVLMAKNYIDNLSEETSKGMLEKAEQGMFPSYAPLGYINIEKNINGRPVKVIEIDGLRAPIIQKMFRLYGTGNYSLKKITSLANEEGLRSKKGYKLQKSTVEKILKDPLYYGYFKWKSRLYKGTHQPIISKELFHVVQEAFASHNRPKQRKHQFAFTGLLTCGKCGCAITAEIKKGKYVYYHCTGFKGKCKNSYIREEVLAEKLGELIKNIQIDKKTLEWLKDALLRSHQDEKQYHDQQISILSAQYTKLQNRIDQMYVDKLDGNISEEFYEEKLHEWREEQSCIRSTIQRHEQANVNYLFQGVHILELAQKAYSLYVKQKPTQQRRLLNFVLSNCTLIDEKLYPTYKKPFDLIAKGVKSNNWLPGQDSNLQPSGYKLPDISTGLGLSLHPDPISGCRALRGL